MENIVLANEAQNGHDGLKVGSDYSGPGDEKGAICFYALLEYIYGREMQERVQEVLDVSG